MWANFLNFFAFLLLLLALKLFINILAKFKRPLAIRYLLLIGSLGFFWKGLGYFYLINFEFRNSIKNQKIILIQDQVIQNQDFQR